ncbi:peroxidasin homolog, partial [Nephila pilipes]
VSAARAVGHSGRALPSARLVSATVHYDTDAPHARYSLALMQWGQFLDHDLTLTPMHEALGRKPLDCKACDSATTVHPECMPIPIPAGDPFFPAVHQNASKNCISFARSLAGQLTLGRREQMDQVTSYLDASNMYGSDACEARMLRSSQGGRLNSTKHPFGGKDLLPQDITNVECRAPSGVCFESGDIRASEQPGLTCMHTIWMREHNRIADVMQVLNPHWNDETIYQQARRIVSAMMQHISLTEFWPRVLGEKMVKELELTSHTYAYDPNCEATIYNEFAAAAYRFGHTLLKPMLQRLTSGYKASASKQPIRLRTAFFNPDAIYENVIVIYCSKAIFYPYRNPRMPCKNIPSIDLSKWKEKTSCDHRTDRERINIAMGHSHRISPCVTCSCTKEGMVCQSMKISNCFQLASTYTREMILEDDVCKVQCAFAFRAYPQFETNLDNVLGFTVNDK